MNLHKVSQATFNRFLQLCSGALLFAACARDAHATAITWTNLNGGLWSQATNWNPNQVPGISDTALITQSGTYTVTLDVAATVNSLTLGGASGQQRLTNSASSLTINGASTNNANGVLDLAGGTLNGPGIFQNNAGAVLNWIGGDINGPVTVASNGVVNIGGAGTRNLYNALTNRGTVNWTNVTLRVWNYPLTYYGVIDNQVGALFDVKSDQLINNAYGSEVFTNSGTFRKSAGAGATTIAVAFDNTGTVQVQSGTLNLNGGGSVGGSYSAANGTSLLLNGGSFVESGTPTFTGPGLCQLTGGSLTLTTDTISGLTLAGGSLYVAPSFQGGSITNLTLGGASLYSTNFYGPVTVASNGVVNIGGAGTRNLYNALTNRGTVNWTNVTLRVWNDGGTYRGVIDNQAGALFDVQSDQLLNNAYGEVFTNSGTFRKSAGAGTTTLAVAFNNTGTVDGAMGLIIFSGGFTSAVSSELRFTLSGVGVGTGFGQVRFATATPLNGRLSAQVANGFNPPPETRYKVITAGLGSLPPTISRIAGNGYVLDYFKSLDTFTFVTDTANLVLPPLLRPLVTPTGTWSVLIQGPPGLAYRVEATTSFSPTNWSTLFTTNAPTGIVEFFLNDFPSYPKRFYRAVAQ
ncbi:MAG: hypothetical protein HY301_04570 [Verrucomicrobia bacterium]|nr:hypothetical protein [Verrucomicrobiota bacterium]